MYTVLIRNSALGTSWYRGTFHDRESAADYINSEASRSRSFVSYELWTGTPQKPGKPLGNIVHGVK